MKRSLNDKDYWNMLRDFKYRGQKKPLLDLMKRWDELRTEINPNAKWYGAEEKKSNRGFWEGTTSRDRFKCSKCKEIFKIPMKQAMPTWYYCPKCGQKNQEEGD